MVFFQKSHVFSFFPYNMKKKTIFVIKWFFRIFAFCIKTIFNVKWTKKKIILKQSFWSVWHEKWFFFSYYTEKKSLFAVKTTLWTKWLFSNDFFPYIFLRQENPFFLQNDFSFSFRIIRAWEAYNTEKSHFAFFHRKVLSTPKTWKIPYNTNRKKHLLHFYKHITRFCVYVITTFNFKA